MKLAYLLFLHFVATSYPQYSAPFKLMDLGVSLFSSDVNKKCVLDFSLFLSDLSKMKLWASRMVDASGKINAGILNGNVHIFGDYDQCLSIKEHVRGRTIEGKYCSALITISDEILSDELLYLKSKYQTKNFQRIRLEGVLQYLANTTGLLGLCVPKSCSPEDLEIIADQIISKLKLPARLSFRNDLCSHKNQPVTITNLDLYIYSFFVVVAVILCGSTVYDFYLQKTGIVTIFSVYTNIKKLLNQHEGKRLTCVSGIRVIACLWVILAHVTFSNTLLSKNPIYVVTEWKMNPSSAFIWTGHYALDTFFTLSGLLSSYTYLKFSDKNKISLFSFYFNRYIRLTPLLVATVLIHTSLIKLFTDGPYGQIVIDHYTDQCAENWWTSIFYIFKLMKFRRCANHTWYLSVDTQLYLCAPIFLFFIKKHPKKTMTTMGLTFLAAVTYSSTVTVIKQIGFTIFEWSDNHTNYLFHSSYYHMPSWLVGLFFGYLLQLQSVKIPKNLNTFLLFVSLLSLVKLIVNQLEFFEGEYDVYRAALWNGLARPAWSLAICYIIFSCATGNGGYINSFLSHYVFRVLGELTYSLYMVHGGIQMILFSSTKQTLIFSNRQIFNTFTELCVVSLPFAVLMYLAFEAPIFAFKDYMQKRQKLDTTKSE
ncbi:O-acyltransferase like protein-like [Zophobas morio]|uniref:O-acyltransferase like protein-like n=1 Tax=Zophobas morio TaxID=2755281 RepID=UPI003082952F